MGYISHTSTVTSRLDTRLYEYNPCRSHLFYYVFKDSGFLCTNVKHHPKNGAFPIREEDYITHTYRDTIIKYPLGDYPV